MNCLRFCQLTWHPFLFTNALLPGACTGQAPRLTAALSKSSGSPAGAYLCLKTQHHFPCQISDIPILQRYGWLCLIVESRLLLETFYKINYLINACADKMAFSQQTFVIKTNHGIQQETSITLLSYSAGAANLFHRQYLPKLDRQIGVLLKISQCTGCDFVLFKATYFTEVF